MPFYIHENNVLCYVIIIVIHGIFIMGKSRGMCMEVKVEGRGRTHHEDFRE